ncbi:MAG: hypothetical protein RL095_1849 [Verrucomicrobiota bacterium]|jgi:hypothetical protein
MNSPAPAPFAVESFFDSPTLLAVRWQRAKASPVERFASRPLRQSIRPDSEWSDAQNALNIVNGAKGCLAAAVGLPMLLTFLGSIGPCSSHRDFSGYSPSGYAPATYTPPAPPVSPALDAGQSWPADAAACEIDCRGGAGWMERISNLAETMKPGPTWQPYEQRQLYSFPANSGIHQDQIRPRVAESDRRAHDRAAELRKALASDKVEGLALLIDLPGSEAVAAAAALSPDFTPVSTFSNWPHPKGLVPAHETLGATLFWLPEFAESAAERRPEAPPVFICDAKRLAYYDNSSGVFDNRYRVRLPDAARLKEQGVTSLLCIIPDSKKLQESDDLNEVLNDYKEANIAVKLFPMDLLEPQNQPLPGSASHAAISSGSPASSSAQASAAPHTYLGHSHWYPVFLNHYGWNRSSSSLPGVDSRPAAAQWSPSRRNSLFSWMSPPPLQPSYSSSSSNSSGSSSFLSSSSRSSSSRSSGGSWSRSSSSFSS